MKAGEQQRISRAVRLPDPTPQSLMFKLREMHATRFHMFLIVVTCIAIALLVTRSMLSLDVTEMWVRYATALIAAYATFFIGVWIWLHLSEYGRHLRARSARRGDGSLDVPDVRPNFGGGNGAASSPQFSGGGGSVDGGGATGSWVQPLSPPSLELPYDSPSAFADFSVGSMDASGTGAGGLDVGDGDGCLLVIAGVLLAIALAVVFGAAGYVVYQAPAILAEVVFEVLLGSSLARGAAAIDSANWATALLRRTWIPFAFMSFVSLAFASFCNYAFPEIKTAGEVVQLIIKNL